MSEINHTGLWNCCLDIIRDNLPEQTYKTWFTPIKPLKYEDNTLFLQVPSEFFYEYIEEKFIGLLRQAIYKVFGKGTELMYNVTVVKNPQTDVKLPPLPTTPIPPVQKMSRRFAAGLRTCFGSILQIPG